MYKDLRDSPIDSLICPPSWAPRPLEEPEVESERGVRHVWAAIANRIDPLVFPPSWAWTPLEGPKIDSPLEEPQKTIPPPIYSPSLPPFFFAPTAQSLQPRLSPPTSSIHPPCFIHHAFFLIFSIRQPSIPLPISHTAETWPQQR